MSSIVNEGIRAISDLFNFFLQEDFTRTKSTKSTKTTKSIKSLKSTKSTKTTKAQNEKKRLSLRRFLRA